MTRKSRIHHFTHVIVLMLVSAVLFCACEAINITPTSAPTAKSTEITLYPDSSDWSFEAEGAETMPIISGNVSSDDGNEDDTEESSGSDSSDGTDTAETTAEPTYIDSDMEVGEGSYTFMIGNLKIRSNNDISMMVKPEDGSIYDFGARECACTWIDTGFIKDTYKFKAFDATYRYLGYYNTDMSVSFNPYKEIGTWKSPKGHDFTLYLVEILIISHNLEIRILPKETNSYDVYNVSINGRGYYASQEQLQMMDFALGALSKKPYVDPLEGIYTGTDHKYYF